MRPQGSLVYLGEPNQYIYPKEILKEILSSNMVYRWKAYCLLIRNMVVKRCNRPFGRQTIHPTEKNYFNEFVANVLRDNIGIHTYFWPPWRLLKAKHHTATAHFGTLGTIHLRRRHVLGGEGSKICQICWRIVVKNCRRKGGRCQKQWKKCWRLKWMVP